MGKVYLEAVGYDGKIRKDFFWINFSNKWISVGLPYGRSNIELVNSEYRHLQDPELVKDIHTTVHEDGTWHNRLNKNKRPIDKGTLLRNIQMLQLGTLCFQTDFTNSVEPQYTEKGAEVTFPIDVTKIKRGMVFCTITLCAANVAILNSISLQQSKFTHVITASNPWIVIEVI